MEDRAGGQVALIITIPPMFGGGQLRVIGSRVDYREDGQMAWEPIQHLEGRVEWTVEGGSLEPTRSTERLNA